MSSIAISAATRALHPGFADAVAASATAVSGKSLMVVVDGEAGGDVVVALSRQPVVGSCSDGRRRFAFDSDGTPFAGALIAALAGGDAVPAGNHPASVALLGLAAKVATRDVTVLVAGPTGTGKEGLARFIHARSPRCAGPFVAVNCAAITETMLEATLFGYERGAFTGATGSAPGLFRAADGGTLLLDEISELPLALQAKLLRVLQEREVLPVGGTAPVSIDARIIATVNRDLAGEVAAGRFRPDLFYRIAVFPLTTTALATRAGEIMAITAALWLRQGITVWPAPRALAKLAAHPWPGNVRELGNVIARAAIVADDTIIDSDDIRFDTAATADPVEPLGIGVRAHEHSLIRATLAACDGRRGETATRLGISERTLRYKLAAMNQPQYGATIQ